MINRLMQFPIDVVANLLVIAICPFLVLAWIIRVKLHDRARHRAVAQAKLLDTRVERFADSNP